MFTPVQGNVTVHPHLTNTCFKRHLTCLSRSVDNLWKCTRCIVLQQLQHLEKKRGEEEGKKAEYGHKAYLYITWRYSTFQFNLNDTWLSREVQTERVRVPLRRKIIAVFPDWTAAKFHLRGQLHPHQLFVQEPDSTVMRLSAK